MSTQTLTLSGSAPYGALAAHHTIGAALKVVVTRSAGPTPDVIVTDVDDLKDLRVLAVDLDDHDLDDALAAHGMGRVSERHAWLDVDTLRRSGSDEPVWQAGFAAMIAYASSKGWVDTAAGTVRAHLVRSGG
jgi:hypothetical protein